MYWEVRSLKHTTSRSTSNVTLTFARILACSEYVAIDLEIIDYKDADKTVK